MKRNVVGILLTLLLVSFTATAVGDGYNPNPRPFMGTMSGEATFDWVSGGCLDVTGAPWVTSGYATGNMTHLGLTKFYVSHCSTFDGTQLVNGVGTLVAANGDEIWITYTAELISPFLPPPVVVVYLQQNVVVGGTGRFEDASGVFLTLLTVSLEDLTAPTALVDLEFAGSIAY
jgi:hypothetical protein